MPWFELKLCFIRRDDADDDVSCRKYIQNMAELQIILLETFTSDSLSYYPHNPINRQQANSLQGISLHCKNQLFV